MVTVIIPSFDRFERLSACVESVTRSYPIPEGGLQIVVVTSTYTPSELTAIEGAGATVLRAAERTFYSASYNAGAAVARGDYLLFLDDDNVVAADAIWRLWRALERWTEAVVVGPVMYYGSAPEHIWCAGVKRSRVLMKTTLRSSLPEPMPERIPSEDFPNCYMVRRAEFELVKGFDVDRFPQHMAEADAARRLVRETGKLVYCVPDAKVWHFIGTSFTRRLHLHSRRRAYWVGRSRTVYTALYATRLQWFVYVAGGQFALAAVYVSSLIRQSISDRLGITAAYLQGMIDGLRFGFLERGRALSRTRR